MAHHYVTNTYLLTSLTWTWLGIKILSKRSPKEEHNYLCAQHSHGSTELLYPSQSLLINCNVANCTIFVHILAIHDCIVSTAVESSIINITKKPLIPLNLISAHSLLILYALYKVFKKYFWGNLVPNWNIYGLGHAQGCYPDKQRSSKPHTRLVYILTTIL